MSDEKVDLALLGARVLTLTGEMRDLQQRFTAMESRFSAMEVRIGSLEQRFSVQEERMSSLLALPATRTVPHTDCMRLSRFDRRAGMKTTRRNSEGFDNRTTPQAAAEPAPAPSLLGLAALRSTPTNAGGCGSRGGREAG
jgi:hypothetical protein